MSDWQQIALGDLLTRVRRKVAVEDGVTYPAVSVRMYGRGLGEKEPFIGGVSKYTTLNTVRESDVVLRTITAFEAPVGIARAEHDGTHVSGVFITYVMDQRALPEFLGLYFQTSAFWDEMQNRASGTVLRRKTISDTSFRAIPFALPPLPTQQRIVEVIGAVDDQIAALDSEAEALDGVYRGFLLSLGARYGEVKISEVVSGAFAGGTPSRSKPEFYGGDIPWLKSGEVENDSIVTASEFITEAGLQGSNAKMVSPGATVVAMYGQGDTKGRAGFVETFISTNQAVLALVPDESVVLPRFLLHAVRSKTDDLRHRAVGSSQPNLSKGLVLTQTIPMPDSLVEQERALVAIDSVRATQAATRAEADRLREVRPSLLSGLFDRTINIEPDELEA